MQIDWYKKMVQTFMVIIIFSFGMVTNVTLWKAPSLFTQAQAAQTDGMAKVRLILKKLRSSMASMKDFDELEKAGMDKKSVDRMRKAMKAKINQMINDAVKLITAL